MTIAPPIKTWIPSTASPMCARRRSSTLPPPARRTRRRSAGCARNLFATPFDIVLTLADRAAARSGSFRRSSSSCSSTRSGPARTARPASRPTTRPEVGACWAFVRDRFAYFIYGSYPIPERWRVDIFFAMLAIGIVWLLWLDAPRRDLGAFYFFVVLPIVSFILLLGLALIGLRQCRHLAVGRRAGHDRGRDGRHRRLAADRHPAGARPALEACRS